MSEMLQQIPVARPVLDEREVEAVRRVILSGWVTQGPEVARFEQEFAEYVGSPYACAVSNCTTALQLALLAVGVGPGDEVVTVSHSFIATANAVRYCGATPVFVDIQSATYNIDPDLIEPAVTNRTKAILCVHQLGMPCDLARIIDIGKRRGIPVVEDAACAIGSEILWNGRWERVGRPHGDIACFSFHPRKLVTTGDGGMLTTAKVEYDAKFRLMRQHGMSVPDTVRHRSREVTFESYPELGFNFRLTDLQAAMGRVQLQRLPGALADRRRLAQSYTERLAQIPGLECPVQPSWALSNWQSYCVTLPEGIGQRHVMQKLLDEGVSTRRGIMNAHAEGAYPPGTWRTAGGLDALANSVQSQVRGVILPLYPGMADADVARVANLLAHTIEAA